MERYLLVNLPQGQIPGVTGIITLLVDTEPVTPVVVAASTTPAAIGAYRDQLNATT